MPAVKQLVMEICCKCGCEPEVDMEAPNDNVYCEDCFREDYGICKNCEVDVLHEDMVCVDDEYMCEDCRARNYFKCEQCNDWIHNDRGYYSDITGDHYCEDCHGELFAWCSNCDCEIWAEDSYSNRYGDTICEHCHDEERSSNGVYEYGYTPEIVFHKTPKDTNKEVVMGIELETDGDIDYGEDYLRVHDFEEDHIWLTEDASVDGFEITSQPCTLKYWKARFLPKLARSIKWLIDKDFPISGNGRAGLHIHVDNFNMDKYQIRKMDCFIHKCKPELTKFSRRRCDKLERWAGFDRNFNFKDAMLRGHTDSSAMNKRRATLEFRIFTGILDIDHVKSSIELVHAITYFCKMHSKTFFNNSNEKIWETFLLWAKKEALYNAMLEHVKTYV